MRISRRTIFKLLLSLPVVTVRAAPVAVPGDGVAASEGFARVLAEALGGHSWTPSDRVTLAVPPLAEDGAIVPVTVVSSLPDTSRIFIFAERNPGPLLARFRFAHGADGYVSVRLKLNESGPVLAIAEAGGRYFGVRRDVRVMKGGCG